MVEVIRFPGTVEWSGENPGISLKTDPNGPFTTLASFFRVVLSPHGRGHALVLVQPPSEFVRNPAICLTDNEPLARWLVAEFVSYFGAFKGLPVMDSLVYRKLDSVESAGDPSNIYSETVKAGDASIQVNGRRLAGSPIPREVAGRKITTAMLAFSETWIRAE
jgi:hypothetical protein